MNPLIEYKDVRKSFGKLDVLKDINVGVPQGCVTAIVGHNGSGKTTLIKLLLGLVKPDTGTICLDGEPLNGDSDYRDRIGYMAQSARFPDNLTANNLFAMLEDIRGRAGVRRSSLIERFALGAELEKPLRTLSGGTRQKVAAVSAFMFESDVLVLDEPTAGLDPVASSALKDLVVADRAAGRTFVLTSHIMSEIEELSDIVVFLQDGRVRFAGNVDEIRRGTGEEKLERAIAQMMLEEAA